MAFLQAAFRRAVTAMALSVFAVACSAAPPETPSPTPAPLLAASPAVAVRAYVDALNAGRYDIAFGLLDTTSAATLGDANALRREHDEVFRAATATRVTWRGGELSQTPTQASAPIVGVWETSLFGDVTLTGTLNLTFENRLAGGWRVAWTRDALVRGLADGVLSVAREAPPRGAVFAADGSTLAGLRNTYTLGVQRGLIHDDAEEKQIRDGLAALTGQTSDDIRAKYAGQPADWFIPIAELNQEKFDASQSFIERHDALIPRTRLSRAYPQGDLAPHIVGYVSAIAPEQTATFRAKGFSGDESVGVSGIELAMNDALMGKPGGKLLLVKPGRGVTTLATKPFERSSDVTLTISPTLQLAAQKILAQMQNRGAAVVMDVKSGAVLAMASYPNFDLTAFNDPISSTERARLLTDASRPLLNRATQGAYPPASTFKMVTMAASMGEGVAKPNDVFDDPGFWDGLGNDYRKMCWKTSGHGRITLQDGLTASCNIVFYETGKRLDARAPALLPDYARKFGFGAKTGIELPGEVAGLVPDATWKKNSQGEAWTAGDAVNMAIGQGFMLATPLQVAQMTAAIANGGALVQPRVVASTEREGEAPSPSRVNAIGKLPLSAEGLRAIQRGMVGATTNKDIGTAEFRFENFDFYFANGRFVPGKLLTPAQQKSARKLVVAGKTGTAQAPRPNDKPHSWFTAYAPADDPQVAVTVMLENIGEGSTFATPLARQIIEAYFGLPVSVLTRDSRKTE